MGGPYQTKRLTEASSEPSPQAMQTGERQGTGPTCGRGGWHSGGMHPSGSGPDLAIVGAARSGTSLLAAHLTAHPQIDASAVKEPNYFSRHFDNGPEWYESYFSPRAEGVYRLDASVSYTYPQYPEAIDRLVAASPSVSVIYVVRDPIQRAVSHYQFYRHYFEREPAPDFGAALARDMFYVDVSDYRRWLDLLASELPAEQVLVVPFSALTASSHAVAEVVCTMVGIAPPAPESEQEATLHRNNVVTFRSDRVRRLTKTLRHSRVYPTVRKTIGADRLRRIRSAVTSVPKTPSLAETLSSCSENQLAELEKLRISADETVERWLRNQDERLSLRWSELWQCDELP
jgi:Sulfotransferase domain